MALHDRFASDKREAYRQYQAGELSESEAREIIGDDWNACVTGVMMERDLETADWDSRYDDEPVR
jgi:hypothetical protein